MKIPFALSMLPTREPAAAVFVPGADAADLFDLIVRLNVETLPKTFATADGFLVKLPRVMESPLPGVVRLRALADNLFLPVDAELTPVLRADEASSLTRSRGLVFLPGPRVLEFRADTPLSWPSLLRTTNLRTPDWHELPEPPTLADELLEVTSSAPPPLAAILESGGQGIATESPRPENAANIGTQILGTSLFVVGHTMAWLGTKLGLGGIAGAGADMLQKALDRVPRLSEFLMNQQEAMLRRLLKDFREGKIEEALRRAMPLGGPNSPPASMTPSASLPQHSLVHSLQNLLGGRGAAGSAWFTPDDVFYSLQAEYRKQAEAATKAGDFRRAAFIYAKLLNDLAGAAHILSQGGLHRDAAVIYETGLHQLQSAAREWEAAGEIDRAIDIYISRLGNDVAAAELLKRVGDTDRALVHYQNAARKLVAGGKFYEAGELMRTKAERFDLALPHYIEGWTTRPQTQAIACGLYLAGHHVESPDLPRFEAIVAEAYECLPNWSDESTARLFDRFARLANRPHAASVRDVTRDRCLMALATKLTDGVRHDSRRSAVFFPADTPWPAPVVRDALYAAARAPVRPATIQAKSLTRLGRSTVRAVCHMPLSGDLFLGFENGEILHHRPIRGETRTLATMGGPILGLEADAEERCLVVLAGSASGTCSVLVGTRSTQFDLHGVFRTPQDRNVHLLTRFENESSPFFGIIDGETLHLFRHDNPSFRQTTVCPWSPTTGGIVGSLPGSNAKPWFMLMNSNWFTITGLDRPVEFVDDWGPALPRANTLYQLPVAGWLEGPNSSMAVVRWVRKKGQLAEMSVNRTERPSVPMHPDTVPAPRPMPSIFGCHRPESYAPLWNELESRTLDGNPIAAFRQSSGEILIVDANGALTRIAR